MKKNAPLIIMVALVAIAGIALLIFAQPSKPKPTNSPSPSNVVVTNAPNTTSTPSASPIPTDVPTRTDVLVDDNAVNQVVDNFIKSYYTYGYGDKDRTDYLTRSQQYVTPGFYQVLVNKDNQDKDAHRDWKDTNSGKDTVTVTKVQKQKKDCAHSPCTMSVTYSRQSCNAVTGSCYAIPDYTENVIIVFQGNRWLVNGDSSVQ